jgi:hypothetical protein
LELSAGFRFDFPFGKPYRFTLDLDIGHGSVGGADLSFTRLVVSTAVAVEMTIAVDRAGVRGSAVGTVGVI